MFSRTEKTFAGILFVVCAAVGITGFALSDRSGLPQRVWFDAAGGDVIFDHAYHASLAECSDCHHNIEDESEAAGTEMNCRKCHYYGDAREIESSDPTHGRFIGANCVACHQDLDESMSGCDACHIRQGFAFESSGRVNAPVPETVAFETDFGEVTFNHELHSGEAIGLPCSECHHAFMGGEGMEAMEREKSCRACHYNLAEQISPCESDDFHSQCIGSSCTLCHGTDDCGLCHEE